MIPVNRFQIVAACAAVIFIYGAFSSILVFSSQGEFGPLDKEDFSSMADNISISFKKSDPFPEIGSNAQRNPFAEPSMWIAPTPERLEAPPLADLLKLVPSSVLLRRDALPKLGALPQVPEKHSDRKIMTRLKRVFGSSGRSSARTSGTNSGTTSGTTSGEPAKGVAEEPAGGTTGGARVR